jgi:hypothetical protein
MIIENRIMSLRGPQKAGNEMSTQPIVSFLQRTVLHGAFPENLNKSEYEWCGC